MGESLNWVVYLLAAAALLGLVVVALQCYYRWRYLDWVVRVFEEKPLFVIPRGTPADDAEDVRLTTPDGLTLRGCYLPATTARRKGVVLFGLEFGSSRWSAVGYCQPLRDAGYDVFACEPRNQGESDADPSYEPLQWVSDRDLRDARTAVAYLKNRPDADPAGLGVFGISKGGSLGLLLAAEDPAVRCVATDGAFGTDTTMLPYMKRWVAIIIRGREWLQRRVPDWFYRRIGRAAVRESARRRGVTFVSVERAARRLRQPLLMIHGEADTYIKPDMAADLFARAGSKAKELWLVPKAKHNQAIHAAGDEYPRRVVAFFDRHLVPPAADSAADARASGTGLVSVAG